MAYSYYVVFIIVLEQKNEIFHSTLLNVFIYMFINLKGYIL